MEYLGTASINFITGMQIITLDNEIDDNSIDLIFADPPYNIGKEFNGYKEKWTSDEEYLKWCYPWIDFVFQN